MTDLIQRDLQHVWHPCAQMKDFERYPPFIVESAKGFYLHTNKGPVIDAISSWWCKSLGHGHPKVLEAISKQLSQFEHVIGANTVHKKTVELAELLAKITRKQHVFFASDGATAVEIAMKLALHAQIILGKPEKKGFIALKNAYHGESLGTLGVSDLGMYKHPYTALSLDCHFIDPVPYVLTEKEALTHSCEKIWPLIEAQLNQVADFASALIVEPLVQGAGGMLVYPVDFLRRLRQWTASRGIYLIADEIMTGIGRTGEWLACHHADVEPDLICLSKGLTSGSLPLSCVMVDKNIYDLFYADHGHGKSFLHSNTYSGNPLAVSAALATLKVIEEEHILEKVNAQKTLLLELFQTVADKTGVIENVRQFGMIVAGDLSGGREMGNRVYWEALERGALLRPMGKTLYWVPPLNVETAELERLMEITKQACRAACAVP